MTRLALGIAIGLLLSALPARSHNKPNSEHNRRHAITFAFCRSERPCPLGYQALRVAYCESGEDLWNYASNGGTYLGMFQAGPYMRLKYGFSWSPWQQARAAYRYWHDGREGRGSWSPWECARIVGIA